MEDMSGISVTKDDFNAMLGAAIRRRRKKLGWTLQEVSKRSSLNVSKVTLSTIERGGQKLSAFQLFLLCDALSITLDDLRAEISHAISPDLVFIPEGKDAIKLS